MKIPTNRAKFMDELRTNLEDATCDLYERSWMCKRNISDIVGREAFVEYTEEEAPQLITNRYGEKKIRIEFTQHGEGLEFYVDGKYKANLEFEYYKNKTAFTVAVAIYIERFKK